jgi:hypothetical protein
MWRREKISDVLLLSHIGTPAMKSVTKTTAPAEQGCVRLSNQMMFERRGLHLPPCQPPDTASAFPDVSIHAGGKHG